ncbi:hypothetical protein AB3R30_24305 [Leptolyngbyaceae cyanobacterium UHCC 1019]
MMSKLGSIIRALKFFVESILRADELKIYQSKDRLGNVSWTIYDPFLDCRVVFNSEAEVRIWLDRRHYH